MSTTMQIPAFEVGVVRLFAIDMLSDQMDTFNAKAALGAAHLDETFVEVFHVSDLEGLGLAGYLMTGNEVPEEQIDEMHVTRRNQRPCAAGSFISLWARQTNASSTITPAPYRDIFH